MKKFVASKTQRLILDYMLDFKIYHAEIIKTMHEKFLIFYLESQMYQECTILYFQPKFSSGGAY